MCGTCAHVVVVTGGVSSIVAVGCVEVVVFGPGPSLPVLGCGGACPIPCAAGVSVADWAGRVMSGGAFW